VRGRTRHEISGCRYELSPGSVIWFHNDELQSGRVVEAPWSFYTVNFIAPDLGPPPLQSRVQRVGRDVMKMFEMLLRAWRDRSLSPMLRDMLVTARLIEILSRISKPG